MQQATTSATTANGLGSARLEQLFPSPVMVHDWPDAAGLNQRLGQAVRQRRESSAGVVKTNRGGWQSNTDLQDWGDAATVELTRQMTAMAREYVSRLAGQDDEVFANGWRIRAWANVNEHGHFNRSHDHLGAHSFISGVYYVEVGDIESGAVGGGRTRFEDWSYVAVDIHHDPALLRRDVFMSPRNGRMLLFPAGLMHSVEPYLGHAQRITIAFNLHHPALGVPRIETRLQQADWWWVNFRALVIARRKLPEKLYALSLLPGRLFGRDAGAGLTGRLAMAWARATAEASERFEARRNA